MRRRLFNCEFLLLLSVHYFASRLEGQHNNSAWCWKLSSLSDFKADFKRWPDSGGARGQKSNYKTHLLLQFRESIILATFISRSVFFSPPLKISFLHTHRKHQQYNVIIIFIIIIGNEYFLMVILFVCYFSLCVEIFCLSLSCWGVTRIVKKEKTLEGYPRTNLCLVRGFPTIHLLIGWWWLVRMIWPGHL